MSHAYLLSHAGWTPGGMPLTDRSFRYGMSVFETIAIRSGVPLLLEPHLACLAKSAAAAGFTPPPWQHAARAILASPPILEGVARIYVTAGDHDGAESRVALLFETMPIPTKAATAPAVTVEFTPPTPFGKTGSYWPHFLARPASGEEAILVTPHGILLGGAMANLVLLHEGRLLTPKQTVRRGVVRDWTNAIETPLTRADLATADEAFLTNSRIGILPLSAIDGRPLATSQGERVWQRYCTEVLGVG